jgi:RecB family exonuclease
MRTSYSAIDTYLQCPQKYKFQEIDRIRVPKSKEAIFGTLIHETLKFMFKRDPLYPTLDEVVAHFREKWPSLEVLNAGSKHDSLKRPWAAEEEKVYFEEGVRMLKRFYEKNAPWNFTIVDLESRFKVVLADERTGETHILAGIIDRIDKHTDETYEIIDYKTSKRMPSQEALNQNLQLSLYSLGLQKRWPHLNPEDIKLSLYFLKHGEKLSTKATKDTTEKTKEHILKTIAEIQDRLKSGKEFEPTPSPLCDWCGFKPLCPAWKHLYKKQAPKTIGQEEIDKTIKEYFELKKNKQEEEGRLDELQEQIRAFMEQEGLTRVFGDDGYISKKTQQRYEYDFEKIKALLSPLGKWEEILKADETKLRKILGEIPENIRKEIENARRISKEYTVLTATAKKIKPPEDETTQTAEELV